MNNIKTYKDGERLCIVVENCTGATAAKVNRFLLDILGVPVEPAEVPGLTPVEVIEDPMPLTDDMEIITEEQLFDEPSPIEEARSLPVDGPSGTLGYALDTGDTYAVVRATLAPNLDERMRYTVIELCKEYMINDCLARVPETATRQDVQNFIVAYRPLIKAQLIELLNADGFNDLKAFLENVSVEKLQHAYRAILEALTTRMIPN